MHHSTALLTVIENESTTYLFKLNHFGKPVPKRWHNFEEFSTIYCAILINIIGSLMLYWAASTFLWDKFYPMVLAIYRDMLWAVRLSCRMPDTGTLR